MNENLVTGLWWQTWEIRILKQARNHDANYKEQIDCDSTNLILNGQGRILGENDTQAESFVLQGSNTWLRGRKSSASPGRGIRQNNKVTDKAQAGPELTVCCKHSVLCLECGTHSTIWSWIKVHVNICKVKNILQILFRSLITLNFLMLYFSGPPHSRAKEAKSVRTKAYYIFAWRWVTFV